MGFYQALREIISAQVFLDRVITKHKIAGIANDFYLGLPALLQPLEQISSLPCAQFLLADLANSEVPIADIAVALNELCPQGVWEPGLDLPAIATALRHKFAVQDKIFQSYLDRHIAKDPTIPLVKMAARYAVARQQATDYLKASLASAISICPQLTPAEYAQANADYGNAKRARGGAELSAQNILPKILTDEQLAISAEARAYYESSHKELRGYLGFYYRSEASELTAVDILGRLLADIEKAKSIFMLNPDSGPRIGSEGATDDAHLLRAIIGSTRRSLESMDAETLSRIAESYLVTILARQILQDHKYSRSLTKKTILKVLRVLGTDVAQYTAIVAGLPNFTQLMPEEFAQAINNPEPSIYFLGFVLRSIAEHCPAQMHLILQYPKARQFSDEDIVAAINLVKADGDSLGKVFTAFTSCWPEKIDLVLDHHASYLISDHCFVSNLKHLSSRREINWRIVEVAGSMASIPTYVRPGDKEQAEIEKYLMLQLFPMVGRRSDDYGRTGLVLRWMTKCIPWALVQFSTGNPGLFAKILDFVKDEQIYTDIVIMAFRESALVPVVWNINKAKLLGAAQIEQLIKYFLDKDLDVANILELIECKNFAAISSDFFGKIIVKFAEKQPQELARICAVAKSVTIDVRYIAEAIKHLSQANLHKLIPQLLNMPHSSGMGFSDLNAVVTQIPAEKTGIMAEIITHPKVLSVLLQADPGLDMVTNKQRLLWADAAVCEAILDRKNWEVSKGEQGEFRLIRKGAPNNYAQSLGNSQELEVFLHLGAMEDKQISACRESMRAERKRVCQHANAANAAEPFALLAQLCSAVTKVQSEHSARVRQQEEQRQQALAQKAHAAEEARLAAEARAAQKIKEEAARKEQQLKKQVEEDKRSLEAEAAEKLAKAAAAKARAEAANNNLQRNKWAGKQAAAAVEVTAATPVAPTPEQEFSNWRKGHDLPFADIGNWNTATKFAASEQQMKDRLLAQRGTPAEQETIAGIKLHAILLSNKLTWNQLQEWRRKAEDERSNAELLADNPETIAATKLHVFLLRNKLTWEQLQEWCKKSGDAHSNSELLAYIGNLSQDELVEFARSLAGDSNQPGPAVRLVPAMLREEQLPHYYAAKNAFQALSGEVNGNGFCSAPLQCVYVVYQMLRLCRALAIMGSAAYEHALSQAEARQIGNAIRHIPAPQLLANQAQILGFAKDIVVRMDAFFLATPMRPTQKLTLPDVFKQEFPEQTPYHHETALELIRIMHLAFKQTQTDAPVIGAIDPNALRYHVYEPNADAYAMCLALLRPMLGNVSNAFAKHSIDLAHNFTLEPTVNEGVRGYNKQQYAISGIVKDPYDKTKLYAIGQEAERIIMAHLPSPTPHVRSGKGKERDDDHASAAGRNLAGPAAASNSSGR